MDDMEDEPTAPPLDYYATTRMKRETADIFSDVVSEVPKNGGKTARSTRSWRSDTKRRTIVKKSTTKSETRARALTNADYEIPDPTEEEIEAENQMQAQIEDLRNLVEHNRQLAIEAELEREEHKWKVAETQAALKQNANASGGGKKYTTDTNG